MSAKANCRTLLILLFFGTLSGCVTPVAEQQIEGVVSKVHDGDSLHITPGGKKRVVVRLAGIDAPEISQAFGIQSRDQLRALVSNKKVSARCHKRDKYQRQVCVVTRNGSDVNLQMLKSGLAWHYKQFQSEQGFRQRRAYATAERRARADKVGLWAQKYLPPWEYRALKR